MRWRGWLVVTIAALAALLLVGRAVTALVVDHAWYAALGAPAIFWEQFIDTALLQGVAWVVGSLFAFANLHGVRRTILAVAVPSRVANLELTAMVPPRRLLSITILIAAVIGFGLALPLTDWTSVALARHGIPFIEREGILDRDLGFYVYQLPLEETLYLWSLAALVVMVFVVGLLYALTRSLRMEGRRIVASTHVRRHLSVLGTLVLLLLAWSYRLDSFDLLQRGSGPDGLFLRIDHVVLLPVDRILVIGCVVAAPIFLRAGWMGQVRAAFVTLSIVLAAALGGRQVLPILLTRSELVGDPSRRDLPYVATRTLVSRRAYDVDGIRTAVPDSGNAPQVAVHTRSAIGEIAARISLWEPEAARVRVTDQRSGQLDAAPAGWTHTPAGRVAALLVRRPVTGSDRWSVSLADVTQPLLRDSLLDVAVGARGDDDVGGEPIVAPGLQGHRLVNDPAGVMGTPMRGLGMRIAQAWATRDPSLLDADTVSGPTPRLVAYRDVRERVSRLAPIFVQGDDVTPILYDGALLWAVNLYTASDHFPLSQRWTLVGDERSYFHFAATALIDAATGRVRFVPSDRLDAIGHTWFDRLPALVVRARDLPAALIDALPPASEGAMAQARTFARYGSRLEGSVLRHVPDSAAGGGSPPVHLVASAFSVTTAWSVPLLDGSDQLDGLVSAIGGRYRATFWDSTAVPRLHWSAATDRLRASLDSSRAGVPEGSRREPRVRVGRVQVVPAVDGPLLVQSLVWNRADGAPVITRVGVMYGGRIALGFDVADALAALRGTPGPSRVPADWPPLDGAARDERVARLYDVMRDAMRRGEWTRFGAAFDSLGLVVGKPPR